MSPPRLSQQPHCNPSNKQPLPQTLPPSAVCIWRPLASIRVPLALFYSRWTHRVFMGPSPSFPEVRRFYLFLVSPSGTSGDHLRAKVQSADLCFCLSFLPPPPTSHSPPARCLGNQEQMFHFGLAMAALSQPSNALWPLASPQLSQRGGGARPSPSSLSTASSRLPWAL